MPDGEAIITERRRTEDGTSTERSGMTTAASERESNLDRKRRAERGADLSRSPMARSSTAVARSMAEPQSAAPESDLFLQRTIDALLPHVAILGEAGEILMVNRAWPEFARDNEPKAAAAFGSLS